MQLNFTRLSAILVTLLLSASVFAGEPYWIDVRTPDEFAAGHVAQAVNIPYQDIGSRIGELTQDKNAEIYVYCRSGHRAGIAKETLEQDGYSHVTNLGGLQDAEAKAAQEEAAVPTG